jgi:succinate-semialdehyde dehydrogenase / glutarate-semialdehyde dehydrogenase
MSTTADTAVERHGLRLDGASRGASDGSRFVVIDPASGASLAEVSNATVDDALAAVDAAERAAAGWARQAPRARAEVLRRAFELMQARGEQIAELIVRENGKPLPDARGEVVYAAEFFRWYSEEAVRNRGIVMTAPSGANRVMVVHQPVGICVLVTPWNFPAAMATRKIAPALAAGCTVVLKPASETPLTALLIADLLSEAGVPDGVVNVLPSRRSGDVVAAMVNDPRVRKLSFTGSTEVGRRLLALAGETVVNTSMELGGNAPFIVLADADLDAAVEGAMVAKMRNVGEACTAANRFYVHESVAREFTARLSDAMARLSVGPGLRPDTQVGPLINDSARDKIDELLDDATRRGARVHTGGRRIDGPGYFYAPTVLAEVAPGSAILREEIFGPVAPVVAFDEVEAAIRMANDTEYGLVSYVYTQDLAAGLAVGEALESGMIGLNRGVVSDPSAPFGGVKQSGIGREGGHEGLLDYTESKYFAIGGL